MSKREMDRSWIKQGATGRLMFTPPGEDITREAVLLWMRGIQGQVLDLGCGEGRLEMLVAHGCIIGLDENISLLQHAKKTIPSNINFNPVSGSFFAVPFRKDSFGCVICVNTLENYPPDIVVCFLDEMLKLIKPGGRLIVSYRGGASVRMHYLELRAKLYGGDMRQYRLNPRRWIRGLNGNYEAQIVPLLRQPKGWRKWIGTPADARALLIVERIS